MTKLLNFIGLIKKAIANSAYQEETVLYQIGYVSARQQMEAIANNPDSPSLVATNDKEQIIVTLTTHGERIYNVFKAIESIFQQSYKVSKIVLYLSDKEFKGKELPILLQNQQTRGLEIHYVNDIRAYTKLIPAIREYPEATIITIDDDYMYPINAIEKLVIAHRQYPNAVCCHASRALKLDEKSALLPYSTYPQIFPSKYESDKSYMAEGFGAVLYPAHCMHQEVTNEEVFMKLSPLADDLWYKCMQLLVDTPVVQVPRNRSWFSTMYSDETVQDIALANDNVNCNKNDPQLKAIFDYYNLYEKLK